MSHKASLLAICTLLALGAAGQQALAWQPGPEHVQVPIWPGAAPYAGPVRGLDTRPVTGPEVDETSKDKIGGKTVVSVTNVSRPTMTVYPPKGKNTGAAVVVLPGGGYQILAMDLEGTEMCDWLNAHGITAVLLKYCQERR